MPSCRNASAVLAAAASSRRGWSVMTDKSLGLIDKYHVEAHGREAR